MELAIPADLSIPAFLRLTREQRRAGWEAWVRQHGYSNPWLDQGTGKRDWRRPQSLTDEEWAYWCDVEARKAAAKRAEDEPRFEAMRAKAKADREERAALREAVAAVTKRKRQTPIANTQKRKVERRRRRKA